jgi:3D (Asp-Asp-Asp) domain-containing protein
MQCIAVSRDLLTIGINHNTKIKINGIDGIYLVKDKMNKRWKNKIDIYMGENIKEAREWGLKKSRCNMRLDLKN